MKSTNPASQKPSPSPQGSPQTQLRFLLVPVLAFASLVLTLFMSAVTHSLSTKASAGNLPAAGQGMVMLPLQPLMRGPLPPIVGPLRIHPTNPRYFTNDTGDVVFLTGSHTWSNLQDNGATDPPPVFDYPAYLDFLEAHHHNFFRLWVWEQAKWTAETTVDYWFDPLVYQRPGPGIALDGKPQFDLNSFNQEFFDRMRARILAANERGIYVSILLFQGWSVQDMIGVNNPWPGHPFHAENNINGISGDLNGDGEGLEVHTLQNPDITALQEAYIEKVVDTVNDLDNVIYEICNNCNSNSLDWQIHMMDYVRMYEAGKPSQHPIGLTRIWPGGNDNDLFNSTADWISPTDNSDNPRVADGSKVIISDTDHIWGIGGDRVWAWKTFTRGQNPIFMDAYDGEAFGLGAPLDWDPNDPTWVSLRLNLGYILTYTSRIDLANMLPRPELCSSGFCLAKVTPQNPQYLVYNPDSGSVMVDLSASSAVFELEWFNPESGTSTVAGSITGGSQISFTPPFSGDSVLLLTSAGIKAPEARYLPVILRRGSPDPS